MSQTSGPPTFTVGLVQMRSGLDPVANLDMASKLIGEAKAGGADYVLTPEMTNIMEIRRERLFAAIVPEEADRSLAAFQRARPQARDPSPCRLAGDQAHRRARRQPFLPDRPRGRDSRALRQDPHVRRRSRQRRKLSRVAQFPARRGRRRGRPAVGAARPHHLLRPAVSGPLPGAGRSRQLDAGDPGSAFTRQTGEAHWHVLVRARAIENGSFVFAAAQGGRHENGRDTYGHSLVIDPWGNVLAEGGVEPGVVLAQVDLAAVAAARGRVPSLQHGRRFEVVAPMAEPIAFVAARESRGASHAAPRGAPR